MLIILLTALISVILAYFFYREIHRFNYFIYGFFAILALALHEEANIVTLGYAPFGLFLVVMYTGALSKSVIRKRLMMVRAEYAIIATILLLPHAIGYLDLYLEYVFPAFSGFQQFFGVLAFIIFIPLFVTSFMFVRKKMGYKNWKRLHRAAYIGYGLVYLHLLFIQNERFYFYLVLGLLYFGLKGYDLITRQISKRKEISS